ncbi:MAG: UDPGP type 1 family protein [Opitutales bacterium]|jgi:UDP-N-acetylglucosamine/UDP-N-acetylgalactosamine diphosphorylase
MSTISEIVPDALRAAYERAGQGHVFQFWDRLTPPECAVLLEQAAQVDLAEIAHLTETLIRGHAAAVADFSQLRPAPSVALPEHGGDPAAWSRARALGEDALRAGRVACFTVAGGQGTRLGHDGPKGTFAVTPVRGHSLFQVFAEKIRTAGLRYGRTPPWFIMTSPANHPATLDFFEEHRFFGLDRARVHFFRQGQMPAVDFAGRLLLEAPGRLALSPDGHGGALRALVRSGAVETMRAEGVDLLSYFQVDNPLVRCVDAAFLGFHLAAGSEMSSKMAPKRGPGEKVGNFCLDAAGRLVVIEYSDLPSALAEQRDPAGELRFRAGSIAIHVLDREFVARVGSGLDPACRLPFHRADKKIPALDASGQLVKPDAPNGVKFEMFVFDALPFARNPVVIETDRAGDFSPVKNATGADSPATCCDDQLRQFARWLRAAGAPLPVDSTGLPPFPLEISPLFGDDAASVAARWAALRPQPALAAGLVLE